MDLTIIFYAIIAFITGYLIVLLVEKIVSLWHGNKPTEKNVRYVFIGSEHIANITRYAVLYELGAEARPLEAAGLIRRVGYGYIVNKDAVRKYTEDLISAIKHIDEVWVDEKVAENLLRYGIANILFFSIDREEGLILKYYVADTKITKKMEEDAGFIDNLFMLGTDVYNIDLGDIRVVTHVTESSDGYIIAEIIPGSDTDTRLVKELLAKIKKIPETEEQIRDLLLSI